MYAYTQNNPVMYVDPSGNFPILLTIAALVVGGAFIGGASQFTANYYNGKTGSDLWTGVPGAAIGGAFALPAVIASTPVVVSLLFASGIANSLVNEIENNDWTFNDFSVEGFLYDATVYSVLNFLTMPLPISIVGQGTYFIDTVGFTYADKYKDEVLNWIDYFFGRPTDEIRCELCV